MGGRHLAGRLAGPPLRGCRQSASINSASRPNRPHPACPSVATDPCNDPPPFSYMDPSFDLATYLAWPFSGDMVEAAAHTEVRAGGFTFRFLWRTDLAMLQ